MRTPRPAPRAHQHPQAERLKATNGHHHLSLQVGTLGCDGGQGCFPGGAHSHTVPGQTRAQGTRRLQGTHRDLVAARVAHSTEAGGGGNNAFYFLNTNFYTFCKQQQQPLLCAKSCFKADVAKGCLHCLPLWHGKKAPAEMHRGSGVRAVELA